MAAYSGNIESPPAVPTLEYARGGGDDGCPYYVARDARSAWARGVWFVSGALAISGACFGAVAAWLTPAEWELMSTPEGEYYVNVFRVFHFAVSAALAFGVFAIWKAGHRGGLDFWRSTVRPGLMCLVLFLMGCAMTFVTSFAAGTSQAAGLVVFGALAVVGIALWCLRGPVVTIRRHDDYWNRAWAAAFAALASVSLLGTIWCFNAWRDDDYRFATGAAKFRSIQVEGHQFDRNRGTWVRTTESPTPRVIYSFLPVAGGLLFLITLGSVGEARYRWKQASLARAVLMGQG